MFFSSELILYFAANLINYLNFDQHRLMPLKQERKGKAYS